MELHRFFQETILNNDETTVELCCRVMILEYSLGTYTLFETEWSEEGDSITGKGKTWYPNLTLLEMLEILRVYNCWRDSDKTEQIIHINNTSINLYWRGKTFKGYRFE